MEWLKKFEVGHPKIDMEHRVFFDLIQSILAAHENKASRDKVRRLILETAKYAEFHFLSEENIMLDINYPDFEQHHLKHQLLMNELRRYIIKFEATQDVLEELIHFMVDWFSNHTTQEDQELTRYINRAGV